MNSCLVCQRIQLIKEGKNTFFVKELETGYIVLKDDQFYTGYTLFLAKKHLSELFELPSDYKMLFLAEMTQVAKAVSLGFNAEKMNYELLGNTNTHLHWHLIPRRKTDLNPTLPIWSSEHQAYKPTNKELADSISKLKNGLETVLNK